MAVTQALTDEHKEPLPLIKKLEPTLAAIGIVVIAALALVGCNSASDDEGALTSQINVTLVAMRERNETLLRDMMNASLRNDVDDSDVEALLSCIPEGAILDFQAFKFDIQDDIATVTVRYDVTPPGEPEIELDRAWEFERQGEDGTWALSALPDCPFQ